MKDIAAGEELTYDYNFAHFGGEGTTSFTCMCGHPLCRGTLDANPERTRNYGRRLKIQWGDDEFFPGQVLSYHNKAEKYLVLYDSEQEHVKLEEERAKVQVAITADAARDGEEAERRGARGGHEGQVQGQGQGQGQRQGRGCEKTRTAQR